MHVYICVRGRRMVPTPHACVANKKNLLVMRQRPKHWVAFITNYPNNNANSKPELTHVAPPSGNVGLHIKHTKKQKKTTSRQRAKKKGKESSTSQHFNEEIIECVLIVTVATNILR